MTYMSLPLMLLLQSSRITSGFAPCKFHFSEGPRKESTINGGSIVSLPSESPKRRKRRISPYHVQQQQYSFNLDEKDESEKRQDDEEEELLESMMSPPIVEGFDLDENDLLLSNADDDTALEVLASMTVTQLKQQLRLRGKKVSGKKQELVERLLNRKRDSSATNENEYQRDVESSEERIQRQVHDKTIAKNVFTEMEEKTESKRVIEAKSRGADIVDVSEFSDVQDAGKSFRSSQPHEANQAINVDAKNGNDESIEDTSISSSSPEAWGDDAKIVQDYEGRSIVVDGLSRMVIEYTGSNGTVVQAYVVGSRDSWSKFLKGGQHQIQHQNQKLPSPQKDGAYVSSKKIQSSIEDDVYAVQRKREVASKVGLIRPDEVEGQEDEQDPGTHYNIIERDYGDWGVYSPTGAQLSSSEIKGVLLLSDVYGIFTKETQELADKIAFECQPLVVLVPDLFRGKPWTSTPVLDEKDNSEPFNEEGITFQQWKTMHPEWRINVDIRAAAAVLRERYAVSSIAVWGIGYGGGRALEAAAGWYHGGVASYYKDAFSSRPPPPHVDPIACIVWYPTDYDAKKLFGKNNEGFRTFENGKDRSVAVMAIFKENDSLPGATRTDAIFLKSSLDEDSRVKDSMVKIFPPQNHGFSDSISDKEGKMTRCVEEDSDGLFGNNVLGGAQSKYGDTDAEVACLLSTAWMETYTRVFLPTVGSPIRFDNDKSWANVEINRNSLRERRNIRKELEEAIAKYEDVKIDFRRIPQSRSPLLDNLPEEFDAIEEERDVIKQRIIEQYQISPDDDEATFDQKFHRAYDDGALNGLMLDAYLDESSDAYW